MDDKLREATIEAINQNPETVQDYRADMDGALNRLVGQVIEKVPTYNPNEIKDAVVTVLDEADDMDVWPLTFTVYDRYDKTALLEHAWSEIRETYPGPDTDVDPVDSWGTVPELEITYRLHSDGEIEFVSAEEV